MNVARCPRRNCGVILTERHDREFGRIALVCVPCERNDRGLCRDCENEAKPRGMRCQPCADAREYAKNLVRKKRKYRSSRAYRLELNARNRANRKKPERQANDRAYAKRYVEAHPRLYGPAERDYKRVWHRSHKPTRAQLDRRNALRRARYAKDDVYRERQKSKARLRAVRRNARIRIARRKAKEQAAA